MLDGNPIAAAGQRRRWEVGDWPIGYPIVTRHMRGLMRRDLWMWADDVGKNLGVGALGAGRGARCFVLI